MPLVDPASGLGVALAVLPPLSALGCFVLPGISAVRMHRMRSTLDLPLLPFLSMATQCAVWILYGYLQKNATIIAPNVLGFALGAAYSMVFNANFSGPPEELRRSYAIAAAILVGVGTVFCLCARATAAAVIGTFAAGGSVLFATSPLAAVATVLRTRSTAAMPLHTSLILFVNGALWTAFGSLVADDPAIYVPNALGVIAGALQLAVHAMFWSSSAPPGPEFKQIPQHDPVNPV